MGKYSEIIERLENAAVQDREIDDLISLHADHEHMKLIFGIMDDRKITSFSRQKDLGVWKVFYDTNECDISSLHMDYTASIDAAIALVERMLPGWGVELDTWNCKCRLVCDGWPQRENSHKVPALAILLALFRALEAKEGGG